MYYMHLFRIDLHNLTLIPYLQHFQTHSSRKSYADANRVSAVILGGGTGAQLFPLTSTRATPAVRYKIEHQPLITML
jgi:hypothetical protein